MAESTPNFDALRSTLAGFASLSPYVASLLVAPDVYEALIKKVPEGQIGSVIGSIAIVVDPTLEPGTVIPLDGQGQFMAKPKP